VALSQGLDAAPHGVMPQHFPVFSKPMINLRGMGAGSRVIASEAEYRAALAGGHFWCTLLTGAHVSTDAALVNGEPRWWRHTTGATGPGGTFDHWLVHAEAITRLPVPIPRRFMIGLENTGKDGGITPCGAASSPCDSATASLS